MLDNDHINALNELLATAIRGEIVKTNNGRIKKQVFSVSRFITYEGATLHVKADVRFDDQCNNNREYFSITGYVRGTRISNGKSVAKSGDLGIISCGCAHDQITAAFPELIPFIKWHLTSTDGPMYYIANTVYHASDRDYNGLKEGEPSKNPVHIANSVKFDNVPIAHKLKRNFAEFLKTRLGTGDFSIVSIAHVKTDSSDYDFDPKWTLVGYGEKWHECPFDTQQEAQNFADALNNCKAHFTEYPKLFGKGKARDLDSARSCAVWPEATEAELLAPGLDDRLKGRLSVLMIEFKNDMAALGFEWPAITESEVTK